MDYGGGDHKRQTRPQSVGAGLANGL